MSINIRAIRIMYLVTTEVTGNFKLAFGGDRRELERFVFLRAYGNKSVS
jgi:hypothetical protein